MFQISSTMARLAGAISGFWLLKGAAQGQEVGADELLLDGMPIPDNEGGAMDVIDRWLTKLQWTDDWKVGNLRRVALEQIQRLASIATQTRPSLAIGLAQNLFSYFWWMSNGPVVDRTAVHLSADLHILSIKYSQCNERALPEDIFEANQCAWRWRYALMILTELGVELAQTRKDVVGAASVLNEGALVWESMKRHPYFAKFDWKAPCAVNTNSLYFPGPVNRPVWPTESVPLAVFLEKHFEVFKRDLDHLLREGLFDGLYWSGEVSMTAFGPKLEDWAPVSLIKNKQLLPRVCAHASESCSLLAQRPEIAKCTAGDAGAAFARLRPGSALKPHFWNAPRLGVHLGLSTPPGASMVVGGQTVKWEEGKAIVFDDTYVHSVIHEGTEPRYLLIGWFCHPCDRERSESLPERLEPLCP